MNGIIRASAIAMALIIVASASAIILTDGSDAYTRTYDLEYEVGQKVDEDLTAMTGKGILLEHGGSLPEGLAVEVVPVSDTWYGHDYRTYLRGTLSAATGSYTFVLTDDTDFHEFRVSVFTGKCTVTYDAGIGLVNGMQSWSETITKGSYASLPQAVHSSGAYTFMGWSESATAEEGAPSYNAIKDVILHAVWKRNAVQISDATATVSSGQTATLPISTEPADAVLSVVSLGGLPDESVGIDDHIIALDMAGVSPGTYYVTIAASYSGYITGESVITVKVPITIVKPIEYILSEGDGFSYTPVTNPSNAEISLVSVTKDGTPVGNMGGLGVEGRSIKGTFDTKGTYSVTYRASLEGYVDVTSTVFVKVSERQESAPAPVMGSITATPRATEPRVYDLAISGYSNASNILWSIDGKLFASSSPTALYEFPASGFYTIRCTVVGFDGSMAHRDIDIVCMDNYHREAAWAGIEYRYVIGYETEVSIQSGSPFAVSDLQVDGKTYRIVSGTPSEAQIGRSFDITAGDDSWSIQIYKAESEAPVADFDLVIGDDGHTVVAVFKGKNASFYSYDFNGDGIPENGNAFTYSGSGRHTVVCTAVNNISETSRSKIVSIDAVPHEDVDILSLTDFQMVAGEELDIVLTLADGDAVSVSGSAAGFVLVTDGILRISPSEKGIFDLTVTVEHSNGTHTSKTVKVTVRGTELQDLEEQNHDHMVVMAVFFIISVSAIALFLLRDANPNGPGVPISYRIRRRLQISRCGRQR